MMNGHVFAPLISRVDDPGQAFGDLSPEYASALVRDALTRAGWDVQPCCENDDHLWVARAEGEFGLCPSFDSLVDVGIVIRIQLIEDRWSEGALSHQWGIPHLRDAAELIARHLRISVYAPPIPAHPGRNANAPRLD